MKLAIVRTNYKKVDIETYNVQEIGFAKELLKYGVSVDFYSRFTRITKPKEHHSYNGFVLRLVPISGYTFLGKAAFYPGLVNLLSTREYDFIQVHEDTELMTPIILRSFKKKDIATILYQGMYKEYTGLSRYLQIGFDFACRRTIIKNSQIVLSKTESAKKYLYRKGYTRVKIFPIGMTLPKPIVDSSYKEQIVKFKSKFEKLLLYVGILEPRRNIDFILEVLNMLEDKYPGRYGLLLVADGPSMEKVTNDILRYDLHRSVMIIQSIENLYIGSVYQQADLFLLPSEYEIYGMVVLEALYYGLPILSTPTAGPSDIINKSSLGECLPLDKSIWVENIVQLLKDETKVKRDYRRGYIEKNYDWKYLARSYYKEVLRGDSY